MKQKLNNKERNVLIKILEDYADEIINEYNIMTSFKWTRGFIDFTFKDLIKELREDEKESKILFSYEDYEILRSKLYGDDND